jgi:hypothetical protein
MVSPITTDSPRAGRIQTPTLVVLLGSTAGLAGLEFLRHLSELDPRDQRRVACLSLDTDSGFQGLWSRQGRQATGAHTFSLLIAVPAGIAAVPRAQHDQHTFIEARLPQYYANGAGGMRNNGHVALCFNYEEVSDTLDQALSAICHLEAEHGERAVEEVQVNLVAFLGGGTGSGTLADMGVLIRELLVKRRLGHRLNLFCMMPGAMRGCSTNDLQWRQSNAVASILEVLALGQAAAACPGGLYEKHVRQHTHAITNTPLAHEIYLFGDLAVNSPEEVARIVGLDLFMRCCDGSGVGAVEHSKWVDRRALGGVDGAGLPTVFGTSLPAEVQFPAHETAAAFALRSAQRMLQVLETAPIPSNGGGPGEEVKRVWRAKWRSVARFDASGAPFTLNLPAFRREDFVGAERTTLDTRWGALERAQRDIETRLSQVCRQMWESEQRRIEGLDRDQLAGVGARAGGDRFAHLRHLTSLVREYQLLLDDLNAAPPRAVPGRPLDLETDLIRQGERSRLTRWMGGDLAWEVCCAYNESLRAWAEAARHRAIEALLEDLRRTAQGALERSEIWLRLAQSPEVRQELQVIHVPVNAWQGKLEVGHIHSRHLFDLPTLNLVGGGNRGVEALYAWLSGDESRFGEQIDQCISHLARRRPAAPPTNGQEAQLTPRECFREIVGFFKGRYQEIFRQMNLIDLLDKVVPAAPDGVGRAEQLAGYLAAHLGHIRGQLRSPLVFEPQLWDRGRSVLETTIYLGMHWRDSGQQAVIETALSSVDQLVYRGQSALLSPSQDPHRLQVLCGQHAISLGTVRDFYMAEYSAMQQYLYYQKQWEESHGAGLMPVHSSGEMQRLVRESDALGFAQPLVARIIRPTR